MMTQNTRDIHIQHTITYKFANFCIVHSWLWVCGGGQVDWRIVVEDMDMEMARFVIDRVLFFCTIYGCFCFFPSRHVI